MSLALNLEVGIEKRRPVVSLPFFLGCGAWSIPKECLLVLEAGSTGCIRKKVGEGLSGLLVR